ncbi:MAG: hypothetical protein ACOX6Y_12325 [Christensenellales bacterium]
MSNRISVNSSVLVWAIEESQRDLASIEAQFPKLQLWLTSQADPTFKQLKDLSDYLHVPFGYMFLDTPPKESDLIKQFRTINNNRLAQISKDLKDTLSYMQTVSMWMSEHRVEEGEDHPALCWHVFRSPRYHNSGTCILENTELEKRLQQKFWRPGSAV